MFRCLLSMGLLMVATSAFGQSASIHCGRLLDVENQRVLENQLILVDDGRIGDIGSRVSAPENIEEIDFVMKAGVVIRKGTVQ